MLTPELEAEIRSKINEAYCHTKGTESYERKALIDEIDSLRERVRSLEQRETPLSREITDQRMSGYRVLAQNGGK